MPRSTTIIIAAETLVGPKGKDGAAFVLKTGAELTADAKKGLGLTNTDIADLLSRGKLQEAKARLAGSAEDDPAVIALEKRAETAEAALAAATARAESAEAALAALQAEFDALQQADEDAGEAKGAGAKDGTASSKAKPAS